MPWKVSVNLGIEDFVDNALPEKLAALVAQHGLPAHSLNVELTESSATQNETRMLEILAFHLGNHDQQHRADHC